MEKNLDTLAADLAYARVAARDLAHAVHGSAEYHQHVARLLVAVTALDNGGAFREIDEHTDYTPAQELLDAVKAGNMRSSAVTYVSSDLYGEMMRDTPGSPNTALQAAAEQATRLIIKERLGRRLSEE